MIDVALKFLVTELNAYLVRSRGPFNSDLGKVLLGPVIDESGKWAVPENRVTATLVNVEEDRILKSQLPESVLVDHRRVVREPELKLNLHVLFAARFQDYEQALKQLSAILTFFQATPSFTRDQHPSLDVRIEKLVPELVSATFEQLNQMWAFLGGKQLPSALYKVRLVTLQDRDTPRLQPPVTSVAIGVQTP